MPPLELATVPTVLIDVGAWALIHSATGYAVHRLPLHRLQHDSWLLRPRSFERDGRLYERLGIRRWKDRLPEAGALFAGGVSKRHLLTATEGGLPRFIAETRRAELGHWLAMAGGPLFVLWNPPAVAVVMMVYAVAVNAPFIAIQRYNRLRVSRVLDRINRSSAGASAERDERALLTIVAPHQRKEHAVGLTAVDVVGAVGVTQPAEVGDIGNSHGEAPVDEQLVDGQVGDAIGGDPSGGPPGPARQHTGSRQGKRPEAEHREAEREQIVAFPPAPRRRVVAGVPRHPRTVHHPAVQRVAHRFHAGEGDEEGDDRAHPRSSRGVGDRPARSQHSSTRVSMAKA